MKALGRTGKAKGGRKYDEEFGLPVFLTASNLKEFIPKELEENSTPVLFEDKSGNEVIGYKAELLPSVCYVFVDAFEANKINKMQDHIVQRAKALIRGFATVGIIALVDEATGYQADRGRQALQEFLDQFLQKEARKWTKTFPNEFFEAIFKMRQWSWDEASTKKPGVVGKSINDLVYDRLGPGVLKELRKNNPKLPAGYRKNKHFQHLTDDIGSPALQQHLSTLIAFAKASGFNWKQFTRMVNRAFTKYGETIQIDFVDADAEVIED